MSFFNNNKLFLDLDTKSVIDTTKILAFDNITLDKIVARELSLHTIRITFVKNKVIGQTENLYFSTVNMETPSYDILSSNISQYLLSNLENENSDYEINKITKYSEVPGVALFYDHLYDNSKYLEEDGDESLDNTDASKGIYILDFNSELLSLELMQYYQHDRDEEFKFFLTAYDDKKNLIDSTEIIGLNGRTFQTRVKLEYDEIIPLFKAQVLSENTDLKVTSDGFTIKNYKGDFSRDDKRKFDLDTPPGEPYAARGSQEHFRALNTYPNLNAAYANFILSNDSLIGGFGILDLNSGYKSPWIFNTNREDSGLSEGTFNQLFKVEASDGINFDNGFLSPRELNRFNIRRDRDANIKLRYISGNVNDSNDDLTIDIPNNGTWENDFSFFEGNAPKLADKLLRDYNTKNEFKFGIQIPYKIQSYISSADVDFSLVDEFTLSKTPDFNELIDKLLQRKLIEEINNYFNLEIKTIRRNFVTPGRRRTKEILSLEISRNEIQLTNSIFFNQLDRSRKPILLDIKQVLSENPQNILSTLNFNNQIFENENLQTGSGFRNLGTNSFLEDLIGKFYFELLHRQTPIREIFGEIILEISGYYDGKEVTVNYPIDIPEGIYLNEGSYISHLLPNLDDNGNGAMASIEFTNGTSDNLGFFDFNIKINKTKADNLSRILLFGNTANQADQNDTDSPSFLEKLLLEINHVKHTFNIRTQDNAFRNPIIITKSKQQLKNFKLGLPKYIESDNYYTIENVLSNNLSELGVNPFDLRSINADARSIINNFMSNNLEELTDVKLLNSISYTIQVKFRNFILPKDLNIEYVQEGSGDLANLNYSNLNTENFNSNITNKQKYRLFNQAYEADPSSRIHEDIVVKWFSRNFSNDFLSPNSRYHSNSLEVKNYFMGQQYLIANSSPNTYNVESITIGNNVNTLNGNYDYDLLVEDNTTNIVSISVESNIKNVIGRNIPANHDPLRGIYGNLTMNLIPEGAADRSKTTFSLNSNNSLNWDVNEISNVEMIFIPQIINNNIKTSILNLNSSSEITNNSLKNALYIGHNRGQEGNINFKPRFASNCEYSVKNNKKTLEIKIDTKPTTGNFFDLNTFTNRCTSDSSGFIQSGGIFTTDELRNLGSVREKAKIFKSSLMEKTCIVRNFVYRIKITFTNNRILYKNYIVPTKLPQTNLRNTINMDEFRVQTLTFLWHTQNSGSPSTREAELIRLGQSNEMIYNLTNMPYATISVGGISHEVYNSVKLLNVPGYTTR